MNNDIEELTALNRDYVASVQNSDVKRFNEILAQDFYCTNSDKSFVDRATFLRQTALPELLKARRRADLKVWSAACSSGMEAYTAAMVLDDVIRSGLRFRFRILGTDISTAVLRIARSAIYTSDVLAPVPAEFLKRYFLRSRNRASDEVRVVPELRRQTNFMRMNLMDGSYPNCWDRIERKFRVAH